MLLVEDNPADVYLIKAALHGCAPDCEIRVAVDGEKACDCLQDEAYVPDAIVLDLNVPRRDGREVLKYVRNTPRLNCTAVIVLTSSPAHFAPDVAAAADGFIVKPSDYDEFMTLGGQILERWRGRQARC